MKNTLQAGNSIDTWFKQYYDELYTFAVKQTNCTSQAKDLVQETFIAAIQSLDSFKNLSAPKTWLYAILKRKIIDSYRAGNKYVLQENVEDDIDTQEAHLLDNHDFLRCLKRALASLPRQWRRIVVAKHYHGKSPEQICEEFGISIQNYWQIMHRAKLQLKKQISKF